CCGWAELAVCFQRTQLVSEVAVCTAQRVACAVESSLREAADVDHAQRLRLLHRRAETRKIERTMRVLALRPLPPVCLARLPGRRSSGREAASDCVCRPIGGMNGR